MLRKDCVVEMPLHSLLTHNPSASTLVLDTRWSYYSLCLCCSVSYPLPPGKEGLKFKGEALVFDCEEDMVEALAKDPNAFRGKVVIIRWGHGKHQDIDD
jgi:hypothetical protein